MGYITFVPQTSKKKCFACIYEAWNSDGVNVSITGNSASSKQLKFLSVNTLGSASYRFSSAYVD